MSSLLSIIQVQQDQNQNLDQVLDQDLVQDLDQILVQNQLQDQKQDQLLNLVQVPNQNFIQYQKQDQIDKINKLHNEKTKARIKNEQKYIPFIEKYRPKNFNDLILPLQMQYKITNMIKTNNMHNIIITGSPGTGKTSTILCLARKILGKNYKDLLLELNASNNRTLDFINTTVAYFCKRKLSSDINVQKLIIFDEADNITNKAQNLLANLMEEHSHNTRFAFTCNESDKIIESIQSRCMIIRYAPMTSSNIKKRLQMICLKENIKYDEKGIDTIINISNGDIRQAINNLEATFHGYDSICESSVMKLCYHPHPKIVIKIIQECVNMNIIKGIGYIHELKNGGYCTNDILLTILNSLKEINIDEDIRINFTKIISDCYINVSDGIDTTLQLYGCISRMIKYIYSTTSA